MKTVLLIFLVFSSNILFCQKSPYVFHKKLTTWENWPNSVQTQEVSFSPDEKYLAAGANDGTFRVWNVRTGKVHKDLSGDGQEIKTYKTSYSPDGKYLVSVGTIHPHMGIKIWDANSLSLLKTITYDTLRSYHKHTDGLFFPRTILAMDFTPDSKFMITAGDNQIIVWEVGSWEPGFHIKTKSAAWDIKVSLNGKILACATNDSKVDFWHIKDGTLKFKNSTRSGTYSSIESIGISANNKFFSTNTWDSLKIINSETGFTEKTLMTDTSGEGEFVFSVDFSSNGKYFVSGHYSNNLKLWSAKTFKLIADFRGDINNGDQGEYDGLNTVKTEFSPKCRYLVLCNDAGFIYIYKLKKYKP